MKTMRKFGAIVLAIMMIAMVAVAWADAEVLGNYAAGIAGENDDSAVKKDNTVRILKELKVYNTTGGNIYLPTVGYTYTITGETVADGTTVTDTGDHVGYVYTGDTTALDATTKTVSFGPGTTAGFDADGTSATISQPVTAATDGTSYYGAFEVTVTPDTLGHAGIFRYKITEGQDATNTQAKAGVTYQNVGSYQSVRYLDVYVRRAVTADSVSSNYVVYGYVLWCPVAQDEDTSITKAPNVTKTNGYIGDQGGAEYNTWNLVVTKAITGTLAETEHQFPFQVVFTSPNATAAKVHYVATNGIPTASSGVNPSTTISSAATTTIGALDSSSTLKLKNNGLVTFYGIPAGVTVTVQEKNDTYDIYTARATITNTATAQTYTDNQVQSGANAAIITGIDNATTVADVGSVDSTTAWENIMTVVSPTGYVTRFAPYALILVGGILLLVIAKKHKKTTDEE